MREDDEIYILLPPLKYCNFMLGDPVIYVCEICEMGTQRRFEILPHSVEHVRQFITLMEACVRRPILHFVRKIL